MKDYFFKLNLKENFNYILRHFTLIFSLNVLSMIITFLFNILILRLISQDIYGEYKFYITIISVISVFSLSGLNETFLKEVSQKRSMIFKYIFFYRLKFSSGFILISSIIFLILYKTAIIYLDFFVLIAVFFIPYYVMDLYLAYFNGKKEFKKNSLIILFKNILSLSFIYLCAKYQIIRDGFHMLFIFLFVHSVVNIFYFFKAGRRIKLENEIFLNKDKNKVIKFGLRVSVINGLVLILGNIDNVLLKYFFDYEIIAIYSVSMVFMLFVKSAELSLINILTPIFYNYPNLEYAISKNYKKLIILFILSFIFSIFFFIVFPQVSKLILTPKYYQSITYANYMILFVINFGTINLLFQKLLIMYNKIAENFTLNIIVSVVRALIMLFTCSKYGIWGLVFATCFCYIFGLIIGMILIIKAIFEERKNENITV